CNSWRIYEDVQGSWESIAGIIRYVEQNQDVLADAQKPGGWNDPDMLVVGLPNVTVDQAMVQMTLWSMWSAPLIMSNDLRTLKPEFKQILLNRDVIAIDQDPMGIMGKLVRKTKSIGIYLKPVTPLRGEETSYALAVVNKNILEVKTKSIGIYLKPVTPLRGEETSFALAVVNKNILEVKTVQFSLKSLGISNEESYQVRDLWAGEDTGTVTAPYVFEFKLRPTSAVMIKLTLI
ncbi:unnamed protein product, partial [Strongylus vulgaris]